MSLNNPWKRIRVSRFTRNLHPEDHKPGLPEPGPLEAESDYEAFLVRQNQKGEWVGQGTANVWLVSQEFQIKPSVRIELNVTEDDLYVNQTTDANTTKAEETEVPPTKKAARKRWRKR